MKSYGHIWERIIEPGNLREAWRLFKKRHGNQKPVQRYGRNLERNLAETAQKLDNGKWRPSPYHQFRVFEPKPRVISCVPVRDRVVHHALCNVIAPLMEWRFINQSYACRAGRGSHSACSKARELCAQYPYYLKLDIRHYFESVDHAILLRLLDGMFREKKVQNLIRLIVEKPIPNFAKLPGKGLPIGNLTSQWFANFYLDGLDHYCVEDLHCGKRYIRYMDDMLFFFRTKEEAWRVKEAVGAWLAANRSLSLKDEATIVAPVTEGVPFLGIRIWNDRWRMQHKRWKRTQRSARKHFREHSRKEEKYINGYMMPDEMAAADERLRTTIRAMDGAQRWFGFENVYSRQIEQHQKVSGADMTSGSFRAGNVSTRGGNYNNDGGNCRSSNRGGNNATNNASTYANANNGFRLASICANRTEICLANGASATNKTQGTGQGETCTNTIPNTWSLPAAEAAGGTNTRLEKGSSPGRVSGGVVPPKASAPTPNGEFHGKKDHNNVTKGKEHHMKAARSKTVPALALTLAASAAIALQPARAVEFSLNTVGENGMFELDTRTEEASYTLETLADANNTRTVLDIADILPLTYWGTGAQAAVVSVNGAQVKSHTGTGSFNTWKPSLAGTYTVTHSGPSDGGLGNATAVFVLPDFYIYSNQEEVDAIAAIAEPIRDENGYIHIKAVEE